MCPWSCFKQPAMAKPQPVSWAQAAAKRRCAKTRAHVCARAMHGAYALSCKCKEHYVAHRGGSSSIADAAAERGLAAEGDLDRRIIGAQLERHVRVALPGALHAHSAHQGAEEGPHACAKTRRCLPVCLSRSPKRVQPGLLDSGCTSRGSRVSTRSCDKVCRKPGPSKREACMHLRDDDIGAGRCSRELGVAVLVGEAH